MNGEKIVYTEKHEEIYEDNNRLTKSRTFYFDAKNKHFATERNQFTTEDYAFPVSRIEYPGEDIYEGSRYDNGHYVIYRKMKDNPQEEEFYKEEGLVIGGQGIHYYLAHHLDKIKANQVTSFTYLIPARLTSFIFRYVFLKEENGFFHIKVELDSWLLRLVAPSFTAIYDHKNKRIVSYEGLSNWKDEAGNLQKVLIHYKYE